MTDSRQEEKKAAPGVGVLLMFMASGCFATMAMLVKLVEPAVPLIQMVFFRCLLSLPFLFVFLVARGRPLLVRARGPLLWRTVFGMTAMYGHYYALTHMPLAECVFIGRSQPLLLALLGVAFFASGGQILMTMAYGRDKAPVVAAASYASVILSVIYGYLFWGEVPRLLSLVGAIFIIAGGMFLAASRSRSRRRIA